MVFHKYSMEKYFNRADIYYPLAAIPGAKKIGLSIDY
jgi:hypothetical protein